MTTDNLDEHDDLLKELKELSFEPAQPSDLRDNILAVIETQDAAPEGNRSGFRFPLPLSIAAALIIMATLYAISQPQRPSQQRNTPSLTAVDAVDPVLHADPMLAATQWLQSQQASDGGWHGTQGYNARLSTALTALALTSLIDIKAVKNESALRQAESFLFNQQAKNKTVANVLSYDHALRLLAMVKLYKHTEESYMAHAISQAISESTHQLAMLKAQQRLNQRVEAAPLPSLWLHEALDHAYAMGFDEATTARSVLRNQLAQANLDSRTQQGQMVSVALELNDTANSSLPTSAHAYYWTKSKSMRDQLLKGQATTGALSAVKQWEPGGDIMATALTLMAMSDDHPRAL